MPDFRTAAGGLGDQDVPARLARAEARLTALSAELGEMRRHLSSVAEAANLAMSSPSDGADVRPGGRRNAAQLQDVLARLLRGDAT